MMNYLIKPVRGWIILCKYCGEQIGNSAKYCATCRTQKGRKTIFDENVKIFKENAKKGMTVPETLRAWK